MVCAWAAPRRIPRGWCACHGVNAHCQRFACERHAKSGAVAPKSQATLPATAHCRRLLPRWFATWAAPPRGVTSLTASGGLALHGDLCVTCLSVTSPSNGGNCTIRGATRRRHAEGRLLMLQNPHHDPRVMLPHGLNAPDQVESSRWGASRLRSCGASAPTPPTPPSTMPGTEPRPTRFVL